MESYEARMREKADALVRRGAAVILAVESSCDETAVAVVENGRIERANAIASQIDVHALYGGVVPEIWMSGICQEQSRRLSRRGCRFRTSTPSP